MGIIFSLSIISLKIVFSSSVSSFLNHISYLSHFSTDRQDFWLNSSPGPKMYITKIRLHLTFLHVTEIFSTDNTVCDKYEVCELNDQSPPEESHCGSRAKGPILDQGLICQVIGIFYQKQYDRIISWSWYINYCSHPGCGDKSWIFTDWHPHSLNGEKGCEVFLYFLYFVVVYFCENDNMSTNWRRHPLHGEKGCKVGRVGGDDDQSEKPPDAAHYSGWSGLSII